jgi:hypothetical protein
MQLDAFVAHTPAPECNGDWPDIDFLNRSYCDDGNVLFAQIEGSENEYILVTNARAEPIWGHAFGYIGALCGLTGEPEVGEVRAGTEPQSECFDTCDMCAPASSDAPAPGALPGCVQCGVPAEDGTVALSLADFCAAFTCPANLADARGRSGACAEFELYSLATGCGFARVSDEGGLTGTRYYFDTSTGELVGAMTFNDVQFGPCSSFRYSAGPDPMGECADAVTCNLCPSRIGGEGGAAGASGSDGSGLEDCGPL